VFNKLFSKILDSSIWLEPTTTRIVWITLLAAMDQDGYAHFSSVENLAIRARVTLAEAERAVECFLRPDANSGNPDNEGRRIERVPGGFLVLNAAVHRALISREIQREQTRVRVARFREKQRGVTASVTRMLPAVTPASASASASASEKVNRGCGGKKETEGRFEFSKPTLAGVEMLARQMGMPREEAEKFWHHYESNGWMVGKNPMQSWTASLAKWKAGLRLKGKSEAKPRVALPGPATPHEARNPPEAVSKGMEELRKAVEEGGAEVP
jgi:hypothetical protein